jgi:hypothetical protein
MMTGSTSTSAEKMAECSMAAETSEWPPMEWPTPMAERRSKWRATASTSCANSGQGIGGAGMLLRPWPRNSSASARLPGKCRTMLSQHRP